MLVRAARSCAAFVGNKFWSKHRAEATATCPTFDCSTPWLCQRCDAGVHLLESTGEGIHVYDFAHRYFESKMSTRVSAVAVRRLAAPRSRDDAARAAEFCATVRGSLYSTTRDEFTHAIEYHGRRGSDVAADAADMEHRSHFCSKVVAEFLQHMGWLGAGREPGSVMPSDYATCAGQHRGVLRRDVEADLADGVALGPLEIIWTPELGAHLPYRARKKK